MEEIHIPDESVKKAQGNVNSEHHQPKNKSQKDNSLPDCKKFPDTMIGRIIPDTSLEIDWETIDNTVSDGLLPGGCWQPTLRD